ncbi:MAG: tetratricopeptide repeat protein [Acidobacteriota bacterium]
MLIAGTIGGRATAQPASDLTFNQIWMPAAQIHEIKNQFVAAVRQLTEALSGAFGDEGGRVSASIDAMDRTRVQWDDAIRAYEAMLARSVETAEVHVALGTVYLDRARVDDALRELAAAGRLDPRRADVHTLAALACGLGNRAVEAAASSRQAATLDPGNPIAFYALAQSLIAAGLRDEATSALRSFAALLQSRLTAPGGNPPAPAPFERVSLLRQVSGVAPIFPLDAYRSGLRLLTAGSYDQAAAELRRAAAADPLVRDAGAIADPVVEAADALRRGRLPLALRGLEAAIDSAPSRSEAHRVLGVGYWADGQHEKSAAQLRAAIGLAPRDERSRIALADVLVDAGRPADAEQALKEALASIPDSGALHYRLGSLYQTLSLLPQAVRELEAAAALDPLVGLDRLYETIGIIYSNQADFDAVVGAYTRRVDVNPNNADGHRRLGEIYFLQGRHDEALAEFFAALLIDPASADALAGAAQVYTRTGRHAEAVPMSRRALTLNPLLKEARYALATSLIRLGQTDEGRRELETFQRLQAEAMALAQRQSEVKAIRLDAARRLGAGDLAAAAALYRQALVLAPDDAGMHRDLAVALFKAGEPEPAIAALEQALRLDDSAGDHRLLADAYRAAGRLADSEAQTILATRALDRAKEERLRRIGGR